MILIIGFVSGIIWGLIRGGSLKQIAVLPFKWSGVALVALGLQIFIRYFLESKAEGVFSTRALILLLSFVLLLAVAWKNRTLPGVWLIGLGLLANLVVMLANGGYMPITPEAVAAIGQSPSESVDENGASILSAKSVVLPRDEIHLWFLSDVFIVPQPLPGSSAFSLGDIFLAVGVFWLVQCAMIKQKQWARHSGEDNP